MKKILLHACCATCSGYPIEKLREMDYEPIIYFFNPNIFPPEEFDKRLNELIKYAEKKDVGLIIDKQDSSNWYNAIAGLENEPEKGKRCDKCIELRLFKTAQKAKELGIREFTTSLTISPHKNFDKIHALGENIAKDFELIYPPFNFKKKDGFLKTNQISKELNLYRQNYCGCKFAKNI